MRYEGDINTAQGEWKLCRAALLKDNAPDSELSVTGSSPLREQQILISILKIQVLKYFTLMIFK